ncbi:putative ADP-ribosylglycohydrolase [Escherichia coli]|uniref:Putative ADP-ribosylglycohydrolase n=59 Tax=root TaxID=1 RepID=A0A377BRX5_ECOLX|nr:putative ADP-ribosylglycohydrolase [Escherichia coli]
MKTERILGALYGQALGDAMGMPSELWPRSRVKAHFGWIDRFLPGPKENNAACYFNRAEFTDDTSMALCLADALLEREGKIDPDLIGRNILDWALRFDAFNKNVLGPTSKIALNAIRDGKPVAELENNGVTNGAAMRVSPLGCLLPARDVDSFIDDVALASSPTHKSDLAVAGAVVIAWAISRAIDGESWSAIVDSLPSIARHAQQKRITTFSASLAARLEIALKIVRNADGTESASEQLYQVVGAGTSTIESVPCAIALVELAQTDPNRCAVLCANLGGDTDTIGAMATAICGALHGVNAIDPALKAELDAVNQLDFNRYATALAKISSTTGGGMSGARLHTLLPELTSRQPVMVVGAAVIDVIADAYALPWRGCDIELKQQSVNVGGCALNIAVALKRLGIEAGNALPLGQGVWAEIIRNRMAKEGLISLIDNAEGDNGWCLALVEPDGERTFMSFSGVENQWNRQWLARLTVAPGSLLYFSGYQLASPCGELLVEWLEKLQDVTPFIDFGPRIGDIPDALLARIMACRPLVSLNRQEAEIAAERFALSAEITTLGKQWQEKFAAPLIIRLDKEGAWYFSNDASGCIPAFPTQVVDTIGAGDSHAGGVLAGLASGLPLADAVLLGQCSGVVGCRASRR